MKIYNSKRQFLFSSHGYRYNNCYEFFFEKYELNDDGYSAPGEKTTDSLVCDIRCVRQKSSTNKKIFKKNEKESLKKSES